MLDFFRKKIAHVNRRNNMALTTMQQEILASHMIDVVDDPEFAVLIAQRIESMSIPAWVPILTSIWRNDMTKLSDALTAVGNAIAANSAAINPAHLAAIDSSITALQNHDAADDAEIADVINSLTALSIAATAAAGSTGSASIPVISSISPANGAVAGGDTLTITGTGFTGATAVNFGTTAGVNMTVSGDTSITVTTPALTAGAVDVTVVTPAGTSVTGTSNQFTAA